MWVLGIIFCEIGLAAAIVQDAGLFIWFNVLALVCFGIQKVLDKRLAMR